MKILSKIGLDTHIQALDTDCKKTTVLQLLKHGRVLVSKDSDDYCNLAYVEWCLGSRMLGAGLGTDCDGKITAAVRALLASFYAGVRVPPAIIEAVQAHSIADRYDPVDIVDVSTHDGTIFWSIMHSKHSWSTSTPRWRDGSFNVVDFVLGWPKHSRRVIDTQNVMIMMPEGGYDWHIELGERTWTRPRWFKKVVRGFSAEAKAGNGIPFPGKGENSWDCGPDALSALYAPCTSYADAIAKITSRVLELRNRRGARPDYCDGGRHDYERRTA